MRNSSLRLFIITSLVFFGVFYYYSGQVEAHYRDNANKYLNEALAVISDWNINSLKPQLASETLNAISDAQLQQALGDYRPLGKFVSMEEPVFSRVSGALSVFGTKPRLGYSSRVRFENGSAVMTATLTLEDQHFRFYNLSFGEAERP